MPSETAKKDGGMAPVFLGPVAPLFRGGLQFQ